MNATFTLTVPVPPQLLLDLLTTAFEGGSAYWLACDHPVRDADLNVTHIIGCYDREDEETQWPDVTLETMALGIQRIADPMFNIGSSIRAAVLLACIEPDNCDWDAETADCVLQAGMFHELVYG